MLHGLNIEFNDKTQETLNAMNQSHYKFYLTGSRYFKTHNDNSDYDFFVEDDLEVGCPKSNLEVWLLDKGFVKYSEPGEYNDLVTRCVYRFYPSELDRYDMFNPNTKWTIDVQLIAKKDVDTKKMAQDILFNHPELLQDNGKERARFVWDRMLRTVRKIRRDYPV